MATEQQIRNRISYKRYKKIAKRINELGVPRYKLGEVIQLLHDDLMEKYQGYRSESAAKYAQQSINLLKSEYESKIKKAA